MFPSGGRVHGPVPKSYKYSLPKKVRRMGLRTALSVRYAQVRFNFYIFEIVTLKQYLFILRRPAMRAEAQYMYMAMLVAIKQIADLQSR